MRGVYVATFGCRVNQADSQSILGDLADRGLAPAASHRDAELVVINTCTVTHRSDTDVRKLVARIGRDNPDAMVVVTGCSAQRDPQALVRIGGAHAVIGQSNAHEVADVAMALLAGDPGPGVLHSPMDAIEPPPIRLSAALHDRTRPFVKIQDGCDARCTYCVIPSVRGPARSADPERVIGHVRTLVERGHREIVLAGIHLGTHPRLAGLVRRCLEEIDGLHRLRLSAIEPMAFPLELVDVAAADPRLAPHFHLPLQSGSDRVLKRMNRPYRRRDFEALVERIRAALPDACVGTDVIAGFPGETDEDVEETRQAIAPLDAVHVFSYSDRPGVPSTRLGPKIDPRHTKARAALLDATGEAGWARFLDRFVGREVEALTLISPPGELHALTPSYCPLVIDGPSLPPNQPIRARITARDGDRLRADLRPPAP